MLVAAYLIRRLVRNGRPLESVAGVCGLLVAIFAGTAVSATIGPLSLRLGNVLSTSDLPHVWHTWWLGDTAGALVVVPLALAWWRPLDLSWTRARIAEGALMLSAVIVLTEIALRTDRPLVYIVFPSLIWAALRFGPRGGTLAVAVAVGFTLWKTAHHAGPFVVDSIPRSTLSTQLYVSVAALSTMFLAAVVAEREAISKGLRESRARLMTRGGSGAPPAREQPARRRPAHADDARRPARDRQGGVATQSRPRARALRGCGDTPPDRDRRAPRSGARDPSDDPHRPRPRGGDPQPDRRLTGADPAARAARAAGSIRPPRRPPTTSSPRR